METCVLIPQEFSLVVSSQDRLGEAGFNNNNEYVKEKREVSVYSNTRIPQGTVVYPFQGTVRLDNLHEYGQLHDSDVSPPIPSYTTHNIRVSDAVKDLLPPNMSCEIKCAFFKEKNTFLWISEEIVTASNRISVRYDT